MKHCAKIISFVRSFPSLREKNFSELRWTILKSRSPRIFCDTMFIVEWTLASLVTSPFFDISHGKSRGTPLQVPKHYFLWFAYKFYGIVSYTRWFRIFDPQFSILILHRDIWFFKTIFLSENFVMFLGRFGLFLSYELIWKFSTFYITHASQLISSHIFSFSRPACTASCLPRQWPQHMPQGQLRGIRCHHFFVPPHAPRMHVGYVVGIPWNRQRLHSSLNIPAS